MSFYSDLAQIRPKVIAHVIYQNVQDSEALRLKISAQFSRFFFESAVQKRLEHNRKPNQASK